MDRSREDAHQVRAWLAAEAAGDPVAALEHHARVPALAGSLHGVHLATLAELGDDAPSWMYSRWATVQALRHRPLDDHGGGSDLELCAGSLLQRDWVVRQLRVFDDGGLRDFLAARAGVGLVARCDDLAAWADAPMGGYRLEAERHGRLRVIDLGCGRRLDLLDLGLLACHEPGTCVIGRLVPTSAPPWTMFESAPLVVDEETAVAVAGERLEGRWFDRLAEAEGCARLAPCYASIPDPSLVSDLPQQAWLGLLPEAALRREDDSATCADLALAVIATVLDHTELLGAEIEVARHAIAAVLLEPGLQDQVRQRYAVPARAGAWRTLAEVVPGPAQVRCRRYAELAAGA